MPLTRSQTQENLFKSIEYFTYLQPIDKTIESKLHQERAIALISKFYIDFETVQEIYNTYNIDNIEQVKLLVYYAVIKRRLQPAWTPKATTLALLEFFINERYRLIDCPICGLPFGSYCRNR